jgi:hypothetical protein
MDRLAKLEAELVASKSSPVQPATEPAPTAAVGGDAAVQALKRENDLLTQRLKALDGQIAQRDSAERTKISQQLIKLGADANAVAKQNLEFLRGAAWWNDLVQEAIHSTTKSVVAEGDEAGLVPMGGAFPYINNPDGTRRRRKLGEAP